MQIEATFSGFTDCSLNFRRNVPVASGASAEAELDLMADLLLSAMSEERAYMLMARIAERLQNREIRELTEDHPNQLLQVLYSHGGVAVAYRLLSPDQPMFGHNQPDAVDELLDDPDMDEPFDSPEEPEG